MTIERKFIRKYFEFPSGRREWCVTGELGSLSFWASPVSKESVESFGAEYYGGVETHYNEKSKPSYMNESAEHADCHANGGRCWHDGTSSWASEYWIPYVLPHGDEIIWKTLESYYDLKNIEAQKGE